MQYTYISSFDDVEQLFRTHHNEFCTLVCVDKKKRESIYKLDLSSLLDELCNETGNSYKIYMTMHEESNMFLIRFVDVRQVCDFRGEHIDSGRLNKFHPCVSVKNGILYEDSIKNIMGDKSCNLILKFDCDRLQFCLELIPNLKQLHLVNYTVWFMIFIAVGYLLYYCMYDGRQV